MVRAGRSKRSPDRENRAVGRETESGVGEIVFGQEQCDDTGDHRGAGQAVQGHRRLIVLVDPAVCLGHLHLIAVLCDAARVGWELIERSKVFDIEPIIETKHQLARAQEEIKELNGLVVWLLSMNEACKAKIESFLRERGGV